MKTYLITAGSFLLPDGTTRGVGDTIELDDDVAKAQKHQLQLQQPGDAGSTDAAHTDGEA